MLPLPRACTTPRTTTSCSPSPSIPSRMTASTTTDMATPKPLHAQILHTVTPISGIYPTTHISAPHSVSNVVPPTALSAGGCTTGRPTKRFLSPPLTMSPRVSRSQRRLSKTWVESRGRNWKLRPCRLIVAFVVSRKDFLHFLPHVLRLRTSFDHCICLYHEIHLCEK